jgi:hypothetical protein
MGRHWCICVTTSTIVVYTAPPLAYRRKHDETPVFVFLIKDRVP